LNDPTAKPLLSLLAYEDDRPVGHILFTAASLEKTEKPLNAAILAPLAVVPDAQRQGIGGKLIIRGLQLLSESAVDLVFVLGHPEYYPRYGFKPASGFGLDAPYPIPIKDLDAWMVQALRPGVLDSAGGRVVCADAMNKPEYWRE
jgi:putative acetyltransferase